jgi:hypothetical protein
MKISRLDLDWAVHSDIISSEQAVTLWDGLETRQAARPNFETAHVAYYVGALLIIGAMGWFMNEAWERFGGLGLTLIALTYGAAFLSAGWSLWVKPGYRIPGGLLCTVAVCMVPLAVYGLERWTGFWPQGDPGMYSGYHVWVRASWLWMEVATIVAAIVILYWIRFPFLTAPIAFSLWYMSMDLTPLLFGRMDFSWDERLWVSLWFGLAMLTAAVIVDRKTEQDYAFWGYLFGLMAFWGGLSLMKSDSELNKFLYCVINLGLMVFSVLWHRRAFLVFGALGVTGYLGHLAYTVFKDSLLFPFVLSIIGIAIMWLGILYQRHHDQIEAVIIRMTPTILLRMLPKSPTT